MGVLGSTDLTHYGSNYNFSPSDSLNDPLKWVEESDRRILKAMMEMNPEKVLNEAKTSQSACSAGAADLFVAPTGSDSNSGTLESPFRSLEKARDVIRTMNSNMSEDITVHLRGGRYERSSTFELTEQDGVTIGVGAG